jgi:dUTP pyrophosphatase
MIDKLNDLGSLKDMADKLEQMLKDNNADELSLDKIYDEFGLDVKKLDEDMRNYKPKLYLGFNKLHPDATTPKYNYAGDSGFDLHSVEDITIGPFGRALIPTGLSFDIKDGYEIQVRSKSGLAINQGLMVLNSPGTVDSGYLGEVKVILFNTNNYEVNITKGMKVTQAVLCPVVNGGWVDLDEVNDITNKDRGNRGFGSTGLFV